MESMLNEGSSYHRGLFPPALRSGYGVECDPAAAAAVAAAAAAMLASASCSSGSPTTRSPPMLWTSPMMTGQPTAADVYAMMLSNNAVKRSGVGYGMYSHLAAGAWTFPPPPPQHHLVTAAAATSSSPYLQQAATAAAVGYTPRLAAAARLNTSRRYAPYVAYNGRIEVCTSPANSTLSSPSPELIKES